MIDLAAGSLSAARERVARSADQLSSGERVSRPSDDPAAWAAARRADAARTLNDGRGEAMALSEERLSLIDQTLGQVGTVLSRARELAVNASNQTLSPEARQAILLEVRGLRESALASANTRSSEGEYILAGSQGNQPAFDADGVYQGDDLTRSIETRDGGLLQTVTLSGNVLTADSGVDVFAAMSAFVTALEQNDQAGISAAIDTLDAAHRQVSSARAEGGTQASSLLVAKEAQQDLDHSLTALHARMIAADPIAAASELTQHSQSLEAAQNVAQRIIDLTRP